MTRAMVMAAAVSVVATGCDRGEYLFPTAYLGGDVIDVERDTGGATWLLLRHGADEIVVCRLREPELVCAKVPDAWVIGGGSPEAALLTPIGDGPPVVAVESGDQISF